jgi:hypothetical protein
LEGASVPAYINAFLELKDRRDPEQKHLYRCRVCGRTWARRAPDDEHARPSLVRLPDE